MRAGLVAGAAVIAADNGSGKMGKDRGEQRFRALISFIKFWTPTQRSGTKVKPRAILVN